VPTPDLARCVTGYAARLHAVAGRRHHVASPLGAWLLLALAAPASAGDDRALLTDVLGCDAETAARFAAQLLAHPHPVVGSAAAVWTRAGAGLTEHARQWRDTLPAAVDSGDVPVQAGLDRWAREHTLGLIDRFPVEAGPAYLVLASALATKVSWAAPFTLVPGTALGPPSPWSARLSRVLRTPAVAPPDAHRMFIAATKEAGDVAVHAAAARDGLAVYSVAGSREAGYLDVLTAAHQIACADMAGSAVDRLDLHSLPLGDGPAWVLREELAASPADKYFSVLPAWSARSDHDLSDPRLGFAAAASGLTTSRADSWTAGQAAMARYSRTGFEAAAVTAMAGRAAMRSERERRVAELRFGHPYAVVAVAGGTGVAGGSGAAGGGTGSAAAGWPGVPVFSAWVSEPEDAQDDVPAAGSGRPL
jgi:hypothetical protein